MVESNQGKTAFLAAFATFQANAPTIEKTAENPHFRNKYAPLDEVVEKVRPALAEAGLVVFQTTRRDGVTYSKEGEPETIFLVTSLVHVESGEGIESVLPLMPAKKDAQGVGAALTYARRYALVTILGLATEDDDDGNVAAAAGRSQGGSQSRSGGRQSSRAKTPPTDEQKARLAAAMSAGMEVDVERFSTQAVEKLAQSIAKKPLDEIDDAAVYERVVAKVEKAAKGAA